MAIKNIAGRDRDIVEKDGKQFIKNSDGSMTTTVAFRCDDDFYQRIVAAAKKDRRSIGAFVKMVFEDHLPQEEIRLGLREPEKSKKK